MRMFQRAAVVAAAIAGLSTLGAGVGFAGDNGEAPPPISAVANSSANAVAFGGDYYTLPQAQPEGQPEAQPEGQPEEQQPEAQPEAQQPEAQPEAQPEEQHGEE
ncbi:MAG: hypothetical protein JF597_49415 [Streptomyces sp.]|jgi:hypothetical protein|uniref:hypothetical protein n=1 Tax=unclassified Streptomyces TaxID=2593676 RepID=UPI000851A352|nr:MULTISPECIES: hypothetical protein [unclassified Streptomyces]MBW8801290.1 hypothetical protein [Streptomyces sp.]